MFVVHLFFDNQQGVPFAFRYVDMDITSFKGIRQPFLFGCQVDVLEISIIVAKG
jgi:hypothetical protein